MTHDQGTDKVGGKVLIVDDNAQNVELLQAYLEDLPVEILIARDGMEAMDKVRDGQPDLILLDIMMPKNERVRSLQKTQERPDHPRYSRDHDHRLE